MWVWDGVNDTARLRVLSFAFLAVGVVWYRALHQSNVLLLQPLGPARTTGGRVRLWKLTNANVQRSLENRHSQVMKPICKVTICADQGTHPASSFPVLKGGHCARTDEEDTTASGEGREETCRAHDCVNADTPLDSRTTSDGRAQL